MGYYNGAYSNRLNRYGLDYQSRIQHQREKEFSNYLLKVTTRVDFDFEGKSVPGSLERRKQDEGETICYLLTPVNVNIPVGTILEIPNKDNELQPWLVWWLEEMKASGYNRYVVLKLDAWLLYDGGKILGYFMDPRRNALRDTVRTVKKEPVYMEDQNLFMFVTCYHPEVIKTDYYEVAIGEKRQAFTVTGIDVLSNPGIEYISLDPVPLRDHSISAKELPHDSGAEYYWLTGEENNANP